MKNLHFIIVALASLACCTNRHSQSTKKENIPVIHTIDVQVNEEPFLLKHKADDIKYITLEFSDKSLIDLITKLIFFEEYIVVLDYQDKSFLFNADGSFISELYKIGRGPGESLHTTDIFVMESDSSIHILDKGGQKLIIMDYNLNILSEHKIPFHTMYFIKQKSGEYWFFMNNQVNDSSNPSNLIKTNSQLEILEYKLPIEIEDLMTVANFPSFSKSYYGAIFSLPLDYNIYCLNEDNLYRYRVSFGKHNLPEKLTRQLKQKSSNNLKKFNFQLETLNRLNTTDFVTSFSTALENKNYLYFQFEKNRKYYAALYNKKSQSLENGKIVSIRAIAPFLD